MAEKVVIGNAELWHGDCREILPTLPINDLALTDPPFGIGNFVQVSGKITGRGVARGKAVEWNDAPPASDVFDMIRAVSKDRIIWGANFFNCFEKNGGAIVWDKSQKLPNLSKAEVASCTHYKKTEVVRIPWTNFTAAHKKETDHPCERPVELYQWCIKYLPKNIRTVLDPFMGSGSCAVAAILEGRRFTGIEMDRKYFDIACERIRAAQSQERLFA